MTSMLGPDTGRTFTARELLGHLRLLRNRRGELKEMRRRGLLTADLQEQVMYGVALTNGCRHCQIAHESYALSAGASPEELAAIAGCDPESSEPAVWAAVIYAQALAANDFAEQPVLRAEAGQHWSPAQCDAIGSLALAMTLANRCGNTFDTLLLRLRRKPVAGSRLGDELVVSAAFLAGAVPSAIRIARIRKLPLRRVWKFVFGDPTTVRSLDEV